MNQSGKRHPFAFSASYHHIDVSVETIKKNQMGENIWLRWWCRRINIKGDGISVTAAQITGVTPCFSECRRYSQLRRLHRITLLFWLGAAHKKKWKCCFVIAAAAEEMSLQSLRALVNASKPAGATSIFLFLIGSLFRYTPHPCLFFSESHVRCLL